MNSKKIILGFLISLLIFNSYSDTPPSFKFIKTRAGVNTVKVFFNLEKEIELSVLKSNFSSITQVKNISISPEGYISLELESQNVNDKIREVILSLNSDIDKKFIVITNKKYFQQ